jgi:hypothetical protein
VSVLGSDTSSQFYIPPINSIPFTCIARIRSRRTDPGERKRRGF